MSDEETNNDETLVTDWLNEIGCRDLKDKFISNGYRNLGIISEVTKDDLKEIGVVAGFAKTVLTHSPKLKNKKEKKVTEMTENEEEELIPRRRRKRCKTCHNYSTSGHKKVCSGKCEDFNECPTEWIEEYGEEHNKLKKEKEKERKEQSEERKRKREEEKKEKKEEADQYKKIPLKSWKEFCAENKEEITRELYDDEEIDNIKKQKIIIEISKRYKIMLEETEEENEKRKESRKKLKKINL